MNVIVASRNLFRLELSAYLLADAGYTVYEIASGDALLPAVDATAANLIVFDSQLDTSEHCALLHALLQRGAAPVLVIGNLPPAKLQLLRAHGGDLLAWPYQNDELIGRAHTLHSLERQACFHA